MCKNRLDKKIHPQPGPRRRMQSSSSAGSHHRPSRKCRIRGRSKTQMRQNRRMRDSGKPGDPSLAPPEERRFGATRRFTAGTAGGCENRGEAEIHRRESRRVRNPRQLGNPSEGSRRSRGFGATRRFTPSAQPEDAGFGETRRLIGRRRWRNEDSGQPGNSIPVPPKGCEIRGNSKIHRRHSLKMQEAGQPEASSES